MELTRVERTRMQSTGMPSRVAAWLTVIVAGLFVVDIRFLRWSGDHRCVSLSIGKGRRVR
jgi:hypothetical protein